MFISVFSFAQSGLQYPESDAVKTAEVMPVLIACENEVEPEKRQSCTNDAIMNHIMNELIYPEGAKARGLEGTVVVEFVVNEKGLVSDVKVLRGNAPFNQSALDVIQTLPNFTPGLENGRPVNVKYALPIRFSITE